MKVRHVLLVFPAMLLLAFTAAIRPPAFMLNKEAVPLTDGLWVSKYEVSNEDYRAFLWGLAQVDPAAAQRFQPDTSVWNYKTGEPSPYSEYYWKHPTFATYPVVGVSHEAALAYCEWMTKHYQYNVKARGAADDTHFRFRLPTEAEWLAAGGAPRLNPNFFAGGYYYPRDHKGRFVFNHKLGRANFSGYVDKKGHDDEGYMITAPVTAYYPDDRGLHNMTGNVAEMLAEPGIAKGGSWNHEMEDCRMESVLKYEKPESWLGFRVVIEEVREKDTAN